MPRTYLIASLAVLFCFVGISFAHARSISAEHAYEIVNQTGELASQSTGHLTIVEPFDLAKISPEAAVRSEDGTITFDKVHFAGGVVATKRTVPFGLHLRDCIIEKIRVKNTKWLRKVYFDSCQKIGHAMFKRNTYDRDLIFHNSRFTSTANFTGTLFRGQVEFLQCDFGLSEGGLRDASFSNTVFLKPALFNDSRFWGVVKFQSVVFENDASFVNIKSNKRAYFRQVFFKGDVEFRSCEIEEADFGNSQKSDNVTVFLGFADFRSCEIQRAYFDFADFRGKTSFVKAQFGEGGVSFKNANFGGKIANLESISSSGPIDFDSAYMPTIRFHWPDIEEAVLASSPDSKVLDNIYRRLKELDRSDQALSVSYYLSRQKMEEVMYQDSTAPTEKAWAYFEWVTWGWPTGYGTKVGRIILVALACWIAGSLPILARKNTLYRIPARHGDETGDTRNEKRRRPRYRPQYLDRLPSGAQLPSSFFDRLWIALIFTFALMFKTKLETVRYIERREKLRRLHGFELYFLVLWFLGSVLLALIAITVSNTSPVISKILGEIAV